MKTKTLNILYNILGVIIGVFIGAQANMMIVMNASYFIPYPEGADFTTVEGLKASYHLMEFKHYIMPFLAHAVGTLVGAFLTAIIAKTNRLMLAFSIGGFFLLGGILMVFSIPSPLAFTFVDLVFAYLPMAWLGWKIAVLLKK